MNRRITMHSQSEFAKILEKKLQQDPLRSQKQGNSDPQGSQFNIKEPLETWGSLLGNMSALNFSQSFHSTDYKKFHAPPKPRPANKLSQDQLTAFLFFAAHSAKLEANFNNKDLKRAFRTLAFKMHPDHGGNPQTFLELKAAYDLLAAVFKKT